MDPDALVENLLNNQEELSWSDQHFCFLDYVEWLDNGGYKASRHDELAASDLHTLHSILREQSP